MSNEMIERVAKSAYIGWREMMKDKGKPVFQQWEDLNEEELKWAYQYARIAIEAMREPTEAILDAGAYDLDMTLEQQYKNMIDAALKDD